ncbi:MAG: hypothetical protein SR1Q5_04810 [Quinella sp. 1Q5]|nr:hypothetical protein [Quinella sp. 1Q5]
MFKKVFSVILLLAMMSLPQIVSAEKTDWFDRNFNFRNIRSVIVFDAMPSQNFGRVDTILLRNLQDVYIQNAQKNLRCNIITEAQARRMLNVESLAYSNSMQARHVIMQNAYRIADAWVVANVDAWNDSSYVIPERTVWEQRRESRTYYDYYGNRLEETYYIQVPVTYPPQRVDVSTLQMTLQVYEARRGEMIFARKDVRDREDYQAQRGMFGRICNSFFEDFGKKIR